MEFIETNWLLILIVLAAAIAIAWYIFHAARRTRVTGERRDVLDEGAAPAARNQALIDAPTAAVSDVPSPSPDPIGLARADSAPQSAVAPAHAGNDLARIKGVGPKLIAQLKDLGITTCAQIAAWDEPEIDRIDSQLGRFQGRIRRDNWVEQATLLVAGDETGFAGRFGAIS